MTTHPFARLDRASIPTTPHPLSRNGMDARVKPGHDDVGGMNGS
jgi:hypothetical protein